MVEAFVDVTYRGLEVGRRLKLTQVGPSTAYLEHGTPMPVGAQVELAVADGVTIPAVVLRVHEQVAGADQPPGMRLRAAGLDGAAAGWWQERVSCEDPVIPEEQATPMPRTTQVAVVAAAAGVRTAAPEAKTMMMTAVEAPPDEAGAVDERRTVMMEAQPGAEYDEYEASPPAVTMEADEPPEETEDEAPKTVMMEAVEPPPEEDAPAPGNGRHPSRTIVMSAVELKDALGDAADTAPTEDGGGGNGNGEPADDGGARGKKRRRRRR
jgi:hypothetical protein